MPAEIRKFIASAKEKFISENRVFDGRHASELLSQAGYFNVLLGSDGHRLWNHVHNWCKDNIGEDHYTWNGSLFWFETVEDASLFALYWA